ncbi:general secretion pathway protein GspK [Pseudoruegeria sp. SHC-113]|uniref:general secretion pathway protein GspK n=1 Tax=Pseudoruegeria sp. SHC-113 TaxID=2855439 RepID=UPI0021BAD4B3|nr:general secretion pathway protein GspK [Pseudoruegeria sp. SHC-113]MCT8161671.1 general secretion pathway protein GspK [Pseudoruegeria sp. SHC-113]
MRRRADGSGGFVLLNALVVVLALSLVASFLLRLSGESLARQTGGQTAAQATLYLEAAETLLITRLNASRPASGPPQPGEDATEAAIAPFRAALVFDVPIDRGHVAARLQDRGGAFNVNWLANPDDLAAGAAFQRLMARIGLSQSLATAIRAHLGDAPDAARYRGFAPAYRPRGGPVARLEDLLAVPGFGPRQLERLATVAIAAPGRLPVNVNAAPPQVLAALFPAAEVAGVEALALELRAKPAKTLEEFEARLVAKLGEEALEGAVMQQLSLQSYWYEAQIEARLDGLTLRRFAGLERRLTDGGAQVSFRAEPGIAASPLISPSASASETPLGAESFRPEARR